MDTIIVAVAVVTVFANFLLAAPSFLKRDKCGIYLASVFVCSACVVAFYLASVLLGQNYFAMSVASSLEFMAMDFMLFSLVVYVSVFTRLSVPRRRRIVKPVLLFFIAIDVACLAINPFFEVSLTYDPTGSAFVPWTYHAFLPFQYHLALSYVMVVVSLALLFVRMARIPREYRVRYNLVIASIAFIVGMNALFLFVPAGTLFDVSVLLYFPTGALVYLNAYYYGDRSMLNQVRRMVFDELGQSVVLFDFDDCFAMCNREAERFVSKQNQTEDYSFQRFVADMGFTDQGLDAKEEASFIWHDPCSTCAETYRCDYRVLRSGSDGVFGKLFIMTDNSLEVDPLTGFVAKNTLMRNVDAVVSSMGESVAVVVCDLNGLVAINQELGTQAGDTAIRLLASVLRKAFPEESYFVRWDDAALVAIVPGKDVAEAREALAKARLHLHGLSAELGDADFELTMQGSVAEVLGTGRGAVFDALKEALQDMHAKKMLDGRSAHSSLMDSLVSAQRQNDGETEEHIQRTRTLGFQLGERLGFSDAQQTQLSLLCLLHDIGKIGVPLDILCKPTKLTADEWEVMKSHTVKGYQITSASSELESIAPFVLHHHEAWDGSGYPDGLKGQEIPLLSRVIAIVDSYDAMTNDRPYRKGMTPRAARLELLRCSGTQFDPYLVAEFLDMLQETGAFEEREEIRSAGAKPAASSRDEGQVAVAGATAAAGKQETGTAKHNEKSLRVYGFGSQGDVREGAGHAPAGADHASVLPVGEVVKHVSYCKYTVDANSLVVAVDGAFEALTGYSQDDLASGALTQPDLIPRCERDEYGQTIASMLSQKHEAYLQHRLLRKDGSILQVHCFGKEFFDTASREMRSEILVIPLGPSVPEEELGSEFPKEQVLTGA